MAGRATRRASSRPLRRAFRLLLCAAVLATVWTVSPPGAEQAEADGSGHGDPVRRGAGGRLYRLYGKENLKPCSDQTVAVGAECYTDHEHLSYDYRVSFWWSAGAPEQDEYVGQCRRDTGWLSCFERENSGLGRFVVRRECLYVAGTDGDFQCGQPAGARLIFSFWDRVNYSGVVLTTTAKTGPPPRAVVALGGGVTVAEGESAVIAVTSTGGSGTAGGTVAFSAEPGTAEAADFTAVAGTFSVPAAAGWSSRITVGAVDDDAVEAPETFTVTLSSPSGVTLGSPSSVTVTILDNDTDTPQQTTTPQPQQQGSGCNASGTRLSALSATPSGGSNIVSGFSPTGYTYSGTSIGQTSVSVSATASDPAATITIWGGTATTGAASRTVTLSQTSTTVSVVVSKTGQTCTYTLTIGYQTAPITSCPAWSGLLLVNGACVPACTGSLYPVYDANGAVDYCASSGDCPYDQYGITQAFVQQRRNYTFGPLWTSSSPSLPAVTAGGAALTERLRAVKCSNKSHIDLFARADYSRPGWRCAAEDGWPNNGRCLRVDLSVEAVVPQAPGTPQWSYMAPLCGHSRTLGNAATWTATDAVCADTDGSWSCGAYCRRPAPTFDAGDWTVTVGSLATVVGSGSGSPYVDVPVTVDVDDWGDASDLVVTATIVAPAVRWTAAPNSKVYADWGSRYSTGDTIRVVVPRQSGPPPADDVIRVTVADVADFRSSDRQFVEILRTDLLSNDACPTSTDCTDPLQWPVEISPLRGNPTRDASLCGLGGRPFGWAQHSAPFSSQGAVTCDNLNSDSHSRTYASLTAGSVRYWPRLWAHGYDTFKYSTYGGEATVTVEFADSPPSAPDVAVASTGTGHTYFYYGRRSSSRRRWSSIIDYTWSSPQQRTGTYHAGFVPVAVTDPDGDHFSRPTSGRGVGIVLTAGSNPHVSGEALVVQHSLSSSHNCAGGPRWADCSWRSTRPPKHAGTRWNFERATAESFPSNPYGCIGSACRHDWEILQSIAIWQRQRPVNEQTGTRGAYPIASSPRCTAISSRPLTHTTTDSTSLGLWASAAATDPDCQPPQPLPACAAAVDWTVWGVCYAMWQENTNPGAVRIGYKACDRRIAGGYTDAHALAEHLLPDVAAALASAGVPAATDADVLALIRHRVTAPHQQPSSSVNWVAGLPAAQRDLPGAVADPIVLGRYCDNGTITILPGALPTVSIAAASVIEGATARFAVTLSAASAVPVTVDYSIAHVTTAASDLDFARDPGCRAASRGKLVIPANTTQATIPVCTVDDSLNEPSETFTITLASAPLATISATNGTATGTISDNDPLSVSFASSSYQASEGGASAAVEVRLSATPRSTVTIPVTHTAQGGTTAQGGAGADYSGVPASVTFAAGVGTASFTVVAVADTDPDAGETVQLGFGTLPSGVIAGTTTTATVTLDEPAQLIPA